MKKIFDIIGIAAGALMSISGLVVFGKTHGYSSGSYSYGGDAYTGIQNAAADAANNALYGNLILITFAGCLLLFMGLAIIACFGRLYIIDGGEFKKPDIKVPEMKKPDIKMPDIKMPEVFKNNEQADMELASALDAQKASVAKTAPVKEIVIDTENPDATPEPVVAPEPAPVQAPEPALVVEPVQEPAPIEVEAEQVTE